MRSKIIRNQLTLYQRKLQNVMAHPGAGAPRGDHYTCNSLRLFIKWTNACRNGPLTAPPSHRVKEGVGGFFGRNDVGTG